MGAKGFRQCFEKQSWAEEQKMDLDWQEVLVLNRREAIAHQPLEDSVSKEVRYWY